MEKEYVLKQYLVNRKKHIQLYIRAIIFSIFLLFAVFIFCFYLPLPLSRIEKICILLITPCLSYIIGISLAGKELMEIYQTMKKIRSGDYKIVEDRIVKKYVEPGPFFSKQYFVRFRNFTYETPEYPLWGKVLVTKKDFKKMEIGDTKHLLVVGGNYGWTKCFIDPSKRK